MNPINCISLKNKPDRRAYMATQFEKLELPYRFFDAIEVKETDSWPEIYNRKKRISYNLTDMLPGEIGCYLSHRQVWKNFLGSSEEYCIVLEDDVEIYKNFNAVIESLCKQSNYWELVRFYGYFRKKSYPLIQLTDNCYLVEYLSQPKGTQGYIINRSAAQNLLKHTQSMWQAIDNSIDQDWKHQVKIMGIEPSIISHNEEFPTTLGSEIKKPVGFYKKIIREFRRTPSNFKKGLWILKKRLKMVFKSFNSSSNKKI